MDEPIVDETTDSPNGTEGTDTANEDGTANAPSEETDLSKKVEELKEQNRKLFERAKKAEGFELRDGKWVKKAQPVKEVKEVQPSPTYITKEEYEEGILRTSKGYSDEDIKTLNMISKGRGISILQAEQDPMFKIYQSNKAEEEKKSKAQLGASKGSGTSSPRKEPATRDEHKQMWQEMQGS